MSEKKPEKLEVLDKGIASILQAAGIETDGLTKDEALEKLNDIVRKNKKLEEDLVIASQTKEEEEKSLLAKRMTSYMNAHDSLLTDKSFISRLFNMGVPECFLKLFRDHDSSFTNEKIWEIIRKSNIKTYQHDMGELLSKRRPYGRKLDHHVRFVE